LYARVIEKFGPLSPFTEIVEAENRHYKLLLPLLEKYAVAVPINDWYQRIEIPNSFVECCEVGVAAEIDNIAMYEHLLKYTQEAEIRDCLYRLQAASYNNHLPAFRQSVSQYYHPNSNNFGQPAGQDGTDEQAYGKFGQHNPEEIFAKAEEYQALFQSLVSGNIDQQEISKLLQNTNMALIGGLLAGGLGTMLIGNLKKSSKETESTGSTEAETHDNH